MRCDPLHLEGWFIASRRIMIFWWSFRCMLFCNLYSLIHYFHWFIRKQEIVFSIDIQERLHLLRVPEENLEWRPPRMRMPDRGKYLYKVERGTYVTYWPLNKTWCDWVLRKIGEVVPFKKIIYHISFECIEMDGCIRASFERKLDEGFIDCRCLEESYHFCMLSLARWLDCDGLSSTPTLSGRLTRPS